MSDANDLRFRDDPVRVGAMALSVDGVLYAVHQRTQWMGNGEDTWVATDSHTRWWPVASKEAGIAECIAHDRKRRGVDAADR